MDCQEVQDWVLQAERPQQAGGRPPAVAHHLAACDGCQQVLTRVARLEQAWRDMPVPASAAAARERFLRRLPLRRPTLAARPRALPRWAAAALILLAVGAGLLFLSPTPPAQAAPDIVNELLDWNLDLTASEDPAARAQIYADRVKSLRHGVAGAALAPEDRELAQTLVANAAWLAEHDDPVEEADRFHAVADRLLERMEKAANKANQKEANRLVRQYLRVAERGIDANVARAGKSRPLNFEQQKRMDRLQKREARRAERLAELAERAQRLSQKEWRKALDQAHDRNKPRAGHKEGKPRAP